MTEFFPYENLTWPEAADLPRDVPLVLPLGSSFDSEKVAARLGNPSRLGIMIPSFPFGWRGVFTSETFVRIAPTFREAPFRATSAAGRQRRFRPSDRIPCQPRALADQYTARLDGFPVSTCVRAAMGIAQGWNHPC